MAKVNHSFLEDGNKGDMLQPASFDTQIPDETQDTLEPDWLLVPLLGFNEKGYRLGYGGGFYDRTILKLKQEKPKGIFLI